MANVKYCKSTHRIAEVELFPNGAKHPIAVSVLDVCFHDNGDECYCSTDKVGHLYCQDFDLMVGVLKCFGLEWREAENYEDALEMLCQDYENRKAQLDGFSRFEV